MQMTLHDCNNIDNTKYIKEKCIEGLKAKGVYDDSWYRDRLDEELSIIIECHLEDFFLIPHTFVL